MRFWLNQHLRKCKVSSKVTLLWDGRLDAAVCIIFLFYFVSISESRHFVCKCGVSRIVQILQFNLKKNLILFACGDGMAVCF